MPSQKSDNMLDKGSLENTRYPNGLPNWGTYLGTPKKHIYQDY